MLIKFIDWLFSPLNTNKTAQEKSVEHFLKKYENTQFTLVDDDINSYLKRITKEKNKTVALPFENPNIYRPLSFNDYIGQKKQKEYLKRYIKGTKQRQKSLPHTLIYGSAGTGKTTLAKIIAKELNVGFTEILATRIKEPQELLEVFDSVDGGVLFLDEVHALDRELVEPLYPIMEDFRFENKQFKPFTLIGATTEYGEMVENRKPFLDRFKIKIELEEYSKEDLVQIVKKYKLKTFPQDQINENFYDIIAENCRGTPRVAISLMDSTIFLNGDVKTTLESANIIKNGYTKKDLEYLEAVALNPKGVGLNAIVSCLMTSKKDITQQIEPYLFKKRLVVGTKSGRVITESGKQLINELKGE